MNMHEILRQDPEIWDLFSCKEDYGVFLRDQFDRHPYYSSNNREIFNPKASQYLIDHGYSFDFPDGETFAICLTHDIDAVYLSISSKAMAALRELKQRNATAAAKIISQIRSKKRPFCNFSEIMNLEEKYGARSTFFFMVESPGERDYSYKIEVLEPEIEEIIDRGWEVGLHGGHTTYQDPTEIELKKARLERVTRKPLLGYRNHFLKFKIPDTWEYLSKAGFRYDSTLGYADCAGFRNGMCHPFKPYNLNTGHEIEILEVPLIIMDRTLDRYMRLDTGKMWDFTRCLIDKTERCHGVITILWHNTEMNDGFLDLYEKILQYGKEKGAWLCCSEEIVERLSV